MTVSTKGAFLWLGAGIGGAAIAGPLVPFGLFLLWTSRQCAATAEERGWIEPLPALAEVQQAQQVLVESVTVGHPQRSEPMARPVAHAVALEVGAEPVGAAVATLERQYEAAEREELAEVAKDQTSRTALERITASPYVSRAFFGAQRTGKSYLAAVAAKQIGADLYHINLGSNLGETDDEDDRYWRGAVQSVCCKLKRLDQGQAAQKVAQALRLVETFEASTRPALLVVDEWAEMGSSFNRHSKLLTELLVMLADECSSLESTGTKQRKAIWAIAPSMVATNLVQPAKAIKALDLCYVTIPPGRVIQWRDSDGRDNAVTFHSGLYDQVAANFDIEPPGLNWVEDRIAWVGGKWLPVGELPQI